jgi:hypothetical protein
MPFKRVYEIGNSAEVRQAEYYPISTHKIPITNRMIKITTTVSG